MPNRYCNACVYSYFKFKQIHYPSSPLQPGPIYFLTPRKCGIFGVCCAAIPQQVNFLIDEAFDTGKGANAVISMVHYYLENHGLHAVILHFNADNCTGQNKSNAVIQVQVHTCRTITCVCVCVYLSLTIAFYLQYMMWRVMTGRNASITISFLPAGHTKFSPDTCFGLLKQKFRKCDVDSLDDFATVVEKSASVNESQLVGNTSGEVIVPTYDWTSYFAAFYKKLMESKGIFILNLTLNHLEWYSYDAFVMVL